MYTPVQFNPNIEYEKCMEVPNDMEFYKQFTSASRELICATIWLFKIYNK